jgi:hypothetical protein
MKNTFINSLDMVPNGILILNLGKQAVTFANKELFSILGAPSSCNYCDISEKLRNFIVQGSG